MTINSNNGSDHLDLLVDQIGVLTEVVTTGFAELKTIAQAQQQDINRLVGVVDRQSQTVDRLALMLERLMSERSESN
jgi:hypothetical protein